MHEVFFFKLPMCQQKNRANDIKSRQHVLKDRLSEATQTKSSARYEGNTEKKRAAVRNSYGAD